MTRRSNWREAKRRKNLIGYGHQITYFPEPEKEELAAAVKFMPHGEPSPFRESVLFEAIPVRHTNRKVYEELGYWIGQGVFGTPWRTSKMAQFAVTYMNMSKGQAKKDSEVLMSAPVLAVLSSEVNDRFWCRKNEDFVYALERWKGKYSEGRCPRCHENS